MRRLGVDFDNTLVSYDLVFASAACALGLLPRGVAATKLQVRDALRREGREEAWIALQGHVYGTRMSEAALFPGALEALAKAIEDGWEVWIVSHRTRHPARGPRHDLHAAARSFVERALVQGAHVVVPPERIFFETTREAKLARIGEVGCHVFVDDLPEVLRAAAFPAATRKVLFDPEASHAEPGLDSIASWTELTPLLRSTR